jgi:phosphoglycolate phosphatase
MRFADLDAVTLDAFGTLVELEDPVPALRQALLERGIDRSPEQVAGAFRAEGAYYRDNVFRGRDRDSLQRLRADCARVFLDAARADLPPDEFAPAYIGCFRYRPFDGIFETLTSLRARGLELAVVGNWDVGLTDYLGDMGLAHFFTIVTPAARKPDPKALADTLRRLGVPAERALHIGDEAADAEAAAAVGMHFLPTPLAEAVAQLE